MLKASARGAGGAGRRRTRRSTPPSWSSGRFGWLEVDLAAADDDELRELLIEAWRLTAPKFLIAQWDG